VRIKTVSQDVISQKDYREVAPGLCHDAKTGMEMRRVMCFSQIQLLVLRLQELHNWLQHTEKCV